jgi:hypothetical protein
MVLQQNVTHDDMDCKHEIFGREMLPFNKAADNIGVIPLAERFAICNELLQRFYAKLRKQKRVKARRHKVNTNTAISISKIKLKSKSQK